MSKPQDQAEILASVVARAKTCQAEGRTPVVVFDLDHTLFDNGPRTLAILRRFAEAEGHITLLEQLGTVPNLGLPFLVGEVLDMANCRDEALRQAALVYWQTHFFQDDDIRHDVPMTGALEYVHDLMGAGATIVYLTGRDAPNMLIGTAASLQAHGFPVGVAHTVMLLKPDFDIPDEQFKADVADFVGTLGEVLAVFDNEPGNCNVFVRHYPQCLGVLVGEITAPNPPAPDPVVVRIADFSSAAGPRLTA